MKRATIPYLGKIRYGFARNELGEVCINEKQAEVIHLIYERHLAGDSIGGIIDYLAQQGIPSPTGKLRWVAGVVDNLLSDYIYVPDIIPPDIYRAVQLEKNRRSTLDIEPNEPNTIRKPTRYHSKNVLSGLFICAECGCAYRRITLNSGKVVWKCANRVEHGSSNCTQTTHIPEADAKRFVCKVLGIEKLDPQVVRKSLDAVLVYKDGQLEAISKGSIHVMSL